MQPDAHFTPAQPGDTPGQVEPDDSRPKPIDAADPLDEAMIAAANAVDAYVEANPGPHPPPAALIIGLSVRAAAPIIAARVQAERDAYALAEGLKIAQHMEESSGREWVALRKNLDLNKAGWAAEIENLKRVEAERDEARAKCESLFELLDQGTAALAAAAEERADLRARLATAERERDSLARRCAVRFEETEKLRTQLATAERDARQTVTDKILAHADRYAPVDGNFDQQRLRRHLMIAARLADPTTDEEMRGLAAQMLNDIAEKATERVEGGQW